MHLINFYPSIQLSSEYQVSPKTTLQTGLGYVFDNSFGDERFQNKRGIKARQEIRRYYDLYHKSDQAYYFSLELYLNAVNFNRSEWRTECFDLDCNILFNRRYNYVVRYREHGLSIRNGFIKYLSANIFIDLAFGATLRFIDYRKPNLPPAFNEDEFWGWFIEIPNERKRTSLAPALTCKLAYRFK
ncbi:MAG TPA: hypothetical protein PKC24_10965 [Cyclobacteriaceae bacterium]|nr:hypothetical protein [Cyclobacteriaceae bacterium]